MKKDKYKIIIGIIVAIFVLVINALFFYDNSSKNQNISIITNDEKLIKKYNEILSSIYHIKDIDKCNEISKINIQEMCKDIVKDRFSIERTFKNSDECIKIYSGTTEKEKIKLSICEYNIILVNIKSKDEINKCEKISNTNFVNMCKDIINSKYK